MSDTSSPLTNVLLWGAGGTNIGFYLAKTLAADPQFTLTILARTSSKSTFPTGAEVIRVDDSLPFADLVAAFKGKDAVIAAIGVTGEDDQKVLIDAAIEAGVKRFFPSEFGLNNLNPKARELSPMFNWKGSTIDYLKSKESTGLTWTAFATGLWLDWSLRPDINFLDINAAAHTATFYDQGTHTSTFTTLNSSALGLTKILLNPVATANRIIGIANFERSQRDVVNALEKIQAVKYEITYVDSGTAIREGKEVWEKEKSTGAAIGLLKLGFLLEGYGSDFKGEGDVEVFNDVLGVEPLAFEDVVREAVEKL